MPPPSRHFDPFRIEWMQTRRNSITLLVGLTPRVIRHTTACHLVLAGVDINTIRAWLGHVSISTTNIYAEIDLTLKANAVALCEVGQPRLARSWKDDKDLMAFLKSL
jgi:site-specific recombinase XerC